jgi:outer membrane protein OmpA-like peptidoglycan-associated protein
MLMMGFFVILWVLKPSAEPKTETERAQQAEGYNLMIGDIRGGFGWEPDPKSTDPVDQAVLRVRARNGPAGKGQTEHEPKGAKGTDPQVMSIRPGQQVTVGGKLLFEKGDAKLETETTRELAEIAKTIRGHRNIFLVKGHTSRDDFSDDVSSDKAMDLSIRRAQAVADYLTSAGVEPEILRVQGCSTFEPVRQRAYTPETQANNRRVEVEATATLVEDLQDKSITGKAATLE